VKKINSRAHWEIAKVVDADNYCCKVGSELIVDKDDRKQGARNDLKEAFKMAKDNTVKLTQ